MSSLFVMGPPTIVPSFFAIGEHYTLSNEVCLISVAVFFPKLMPYLTKIGISLISKDIVEFFNDVTTETMEIRKKEADQVNTVLIL